MSDIKCLIPDGNAQERVLPYSEIEPSALGNRSDHEEAGSCVRVQDGTGIMSALELLAGDPAREDMLILVDGLDREIGMASKLKAHEEGLLHRAFSVVLVREGDDGPEVLLARRARGKYHSGGLWANSCCSHPRVGEETIEAAHRRVREELGCKVADLRDVGGFAYRGEFESGLCEFEFDHVLVGRFMGELDPDQSEVGELRWIGLDALAVELASDPHRFTVWAPMVLSLAMTEIRRTVAEARRNSE